MSEISKEQMVIYLESRAKITQEHIEWYKGIAKENNYMHYEYEMLIAIKKKIEES